ncbi:MAG: glycosyltransferase [Planctomycetes bacterium]|nr:glycosyltransferase [Planctomycetota bacterium]
MSASARRTLMTACLFVVGFYLVYRALFTLNLEGTYATIVSMMLYGAELFGGVSLALYFLQVWDTSEPQEVEPLEGVTIDVLVPTYNEDVDLLRGTLKACADLELPHNTYVLDDGKREEVRELAKDLGVRYITRDNNLHAKAGNLNHALEQTDGDFVVIFDADHVPEPHFLRRTVGYFRDEKLAMVQTPHAFYNFDTFQGSFDGEKDRFWEEGQLFYNVIQSGKNALDSVIFAGSAAMFRREALKDVGYIAVETITEDMHTGIRLSMAGWKTCYISERLIAGQAAADVTTFHSQRLRWAEGNLSILFYDNPLTARGLTLKQRLSYFASIIHWGGGFARLALFLTPILMLFSGISPVTEFTWHLGLILFLYLFMITSTIKVVSKGYASFREIGLFGMANYWTQTKAAWRAMFGRGRQKFVVTAKRGGQADSIMPYIMPQLILAGVGLLAIAWGWTSQLVFRDAVDFLGLGVATGLVCVQLHLAQQYLRRAMRPASNRYSYRHQVNLPVRFKFENEEGEAVEGYATTVDLNEYGAGIVAYDSIPSGVRGKMTILANGSSVTADAKVKFLGHLSRRPDDDDEVPECIRYGLEFENTTDLEKDALRNLCMHYAVPLMFDRVSRPMSERFRRFKRGLVSFRRRYRRVDYRLPVAMLVGEKSGRSQFAHAVTDDLSIEAFRVRTKHAFSEGQHLNVMIPTPVGDVEAEVEVIRCIKNPAGPLAVNETVLRFDHFKGQGRSILQTLLKITPSGRTDGGLRGTIETQPVPYFRPAMAAVFTALVLTPVSYGLFKAVFKDDIVLMSAVAEGSEYASDKPGLDAIYAETMSMEDPDRRRLMLLKEALEDAERYPELVQVTRTLATQYLKDPDMGMAYMNALSLNGQYMDAEIEAERVLSMVDASRATAGKRKEVLLLAARNSVNSGRLAQGADRFHKLLNTYPDTEEARVEYAGVLARLGRYDEALQQLSMVELDLEGRYQLVSIFSAMKDFASAEAEASAILEDYPDEQRAEVNLAEILSWKGDFARAIRQYEQLLTDTPGERDLLIKRGELLLWNKEYLASMEVFQDLIDQGENDTRVWQGFLDSAAGAGVVPPKMVRTVLSLYERVQDMTVEDPQVLARLAAVLRNMGQLSEAVDLLEYSLELTPQDREIRLQLADALYEFGDHARADMFYKSLLDRAPVGGPRRPRLSGGTFHWRY